MDEGTDIDKNLHRPTDTIMKSRLLNYFDNYKDGYFSGAVTVLRNDQSMSFFQTIDSPRTTQTSYRRQHPNYMDSLVTSKEGQELSNPTKKRCAH
ncbi:hypothetical protein OnM2_n087049 [Erysiphe neolycopersici]|uniref:Uncharacterized protein n=1 Tax=Erysiphe neolycopersici TaxID=212602 RepID=A0A420HEF9_9PEZI|nr:hypothetical protein OnM2_n087049 [Erysiphe neolycopersici]